MLINYRTVVNSYSGKMEVIYWISNRIYSSMDSQFLTPLAFNENFLSHKNCKTLKLALQRGKMFIVYHNSKMERENELKEREESDFQKHFI